MKLALIGRGPWASVYAKTLKGLAIPYTQFGRDWYGKMNDFDGAIVCTAAESHASIAKQLLADYIPVLIEKPMTLTSGDAWELLRLGEETEGIAYVGHTRLYSPSWRNFRYTMKALGVKSVKAVAGGKSRLNPWWDWGPHLVSMCFDLGYDPLPGDLSVSEKETPLSVTVNGEYVWTDKAEKPTPMEGLLHEFWLAVEAGVPDIEGLRMGHKVVRWIENVTRGCYGPQ